MTVELEGMDGASPRAKTARMLTAAAVVVLAAVVAVWAWSRARWQATYSPLMEGAVKEVVLQRFQPQWVALSMLAVGIGLTAAILLVATAVSHRSEAGE